jgi:hypothetical protein
MLLVTTVSAVVSGSRVKGPSGMSLKSRDCFWKKTIWKGKSGEAAGLSPGVQVKVWFVTPPFVFRLTYSI